MVSQSFLRRNSRDFSTISSDSGEVENHLLISLPRKECDFLHDRMTLVTLQLHDPMQEAGQAIEYCYFPNTAMASVLNLMDDGKSVEVGLIGKEGFVGLPLIAGFRTSANRVVAQGPGTAFRIDSESMRKTLRSCPQLMMILTRYSQEVAMELAQIAACNRLHDVNERLARWLLMSRDRIDSDALPLTQDFLSQMLGMRRASVSVAASILQKAGFIRYERGHVTIVDRKGLESASCECYGTIQKRLEVWREETQPVL
jgi:CRP-like cAMP-binding protein